MSGLPGDLFGQFINYMYSSGGITIPSEFHERCNAIETMLDNDVTGVINTLLGYAINSASETKYRVECSEPTLQNLLNTWLQEVNLELKGIPTGLGSLSKEYFKERWTGSSFCLLRVTGWKKITIGATTIEVPTKMWYTNGSSVYVKRINTKNFKLGSDKYFLDSTYKNELTNSVKEYISISKPFARWHDEYPNPYLIKTGVYKNFAALKTLMSQSDETVSKVLPYLFLMQKGTLDSYLKGEITYSDKEIKEGVEGLKDELEKYKNQKGKTPLHGVPFDQKYEHLMPDLLKMVSEELFRQGYRAVLAGLGFIDVIQGLSSTRKESVLNPKPFLAEINAGVGGFKEMLLDIIYQIIDRNKTAHKKLFSIKGSLIVVNSPLKINVDQMLEDLRGAFDRGVSSITSYQEVLGLDPQTEKERRQKELADGSEGLFYPHMVQNTEKDPDTNMQPAKPKNEKNENQNKKPGTPESKNFKNAIDNKVQCKECKEIFDYLSITEAGMGYVKCPKCEAVVLQDYYVEEIKEAKTNDNFEIAPYTMDNYPKYLNKYPKDAIEVWVNTFNKTLEKTNDESKAFPYAWTALKRFIKKNYIKQPDGTYKKKE